MIRAEEGVDDRHFRETALFKEVVRPFGIEHSLVSFFAKEADVMATLAAMRDEAAGPFGAEEAGRLALLVPHLRRAFEFYALLRQTGDRAADLASALDLLDAAVILTDSRLRVTHANRSAEALARSGSGLSLDNGSLAFRSHSCSRRLAKRRRRLWPRRTARFGSTRPTTSRWRRATTACRTASRSTRCRAAPRRATTRGRNSRW